MKKQRLESFEARLARETGTVTKHRGGRVSVALVYPNVYYIAMSNLGFLTMYQTINKRDDALCERVFLPDPDDEQVLTRTATRLYTLESATPVSRFQVIGFSVSFENDYLHILKILRMAGIPLLAKDRKQLFPLLILGGICASYNPEPLAQIFDVIFLGDGERSVNLFLDSLNNRPEKSRKQDVLERLSGIRSLYIPALFQPQYDERESLRNIIPLKKGTSLPVHDWLPDLDEYPCMSEVLTPDTEFGDMILVELSRGCPRKCSFCVIGECYGRFRTRSLPVLLQLIDKGMAYRKKFGLIGANIADYPALNDLVSAIREKDCEVSFPSLRLDLLSPPLLRTIAGETQKTITLAPEAGSERLRRLIGKPMTQEKIEQVICDLLKNEPRRIKLYLMVGLPTEEKSDIDALITMVKKIRHRVLAPGTGGKRHAALVLSINCFVPKPFTPFQWAPMEPVKTLKQKIAVIKNSFKKDSRVTVIHDVPKWAMIQGLLARGDRKLVYLLQEVQACGYNWNKGIAQSSINPSYYLTRKRDQNEVFPWDHLQDDRLKNRLWENYEPVHTYMQ